MPESTDELIGRLAAQGERVRPLASPGRRLVVWLGAAVAYLAAMVLLAADRGISGAAGAFMWQEIVACIVALAAAYGALLSVVPGRNVHRVALGMTGAVAAWFAILVTGSIGEWRELGTLGGVTRETDWPCVASMLIGGGALAALLIAMLRRGAPLVPRESVALASTAAVAVGSIEACASRPHAFVSTILIWHGITAAVLVVVLAANGRRFLRWRGSPVF